MPSPRGPGIETCERRRQCSVAETSLLSLQETSRRRKAELGSVDMSLMDARLEMQR